MNNNDDLPHVVIIGAGPSGCLLALLLAESGAHVTVYDARTDSRDASVNASSSTTDQRSINLALSTRGLTALRRVNLHHIITTQAIPMHSRCVHLNTSTLSKGQQLHPYGQPGQHLLSVSRTTLTHVLQDACDAHASVDLVFAHKCTDVNLDLPSVTLTDSKSGVQNVVRPLLIVGADGSFSRVRTAMARQPGFNFSQDYIPCLYKELSFTPPNDNVNAENDEPTYTPNALHIWPRHDFMLIALPNWSQGSDAKSTVKTFTVTLFMPPNKFEELENPNREQGEQKEQEEEKEEKVKATRIIDFFKTHFPDALPAMPNLVEDFQRNPTAPLLTIRCRPYNHHGRAVLIGDAAHAIVPFFGQGCNAAMEDAVLLADTIAAHGWEQRALCKALDEYSVGRKPDADAIAALAEDHYYDMSARSASPYFVLKRRIEIWLNWLFPSSFLPLYSLVSFSNVKYHRAVERAKTQDSIIGTGIGITAALVTASVTTAVVIGASRRGLYTRWT